MAGQYARFNGKRFGVLTCTLARHEIELYTPELDILDPEDIGLGGVLIAEFQSGKWLRVPAVFKDWQITRHILSGLEGVVRFGVTDKAVYYTGATANEYREL